MMISTPLCYAGFSLGMFSMALATVLFYQTELGCKEFLTFSRVHVTCSMDPLCWPAYMLGVTVRTLSLVSSMH